MLAVVSCPSCCSIEDCPTCLSLAHEDCDDEGCEVCRRLDREREAEAYCEAQVAYYAPGGFFDTIFNGMFNGNN